MTSKLDQLKSLSVVVADTGDLEAVRRFAPQDCTTNPSIVLKALQSGVFTGQLDAAVAAAADRNDSAVPAIAERLTVDVGAELAKLVPGRVSTEVDADLSFDTAGSVAKSKAIMAEYERRGIGRDRILIKLAATWEGIAAARVLQREGIDCNLTLVFNLAQAVAAADAGAFLISPFVGRITDWYSKASGKSFALAEDPGVASVRRIFDYYKANGIETIVMGASFRNIGQIEALAGCDRLTIAPALLSELAASTGRLATGLQGPRSDGQSRLDLTEMRFRWMLNEDAMATEKLAEGIRNFHADTTKLHGLIRDRLTRQ